MKIGLSTSVIQRGRSGVGQYVFSLIRALKAVGPQHEYVLFVLEGDEPLFHPLADTMRIIRVAEKYRPPMRNILWHQTQLPREVRRLGLDLLHIPSYRRMLWPQPCPLVATIHDLAPFRLPGKYDWARMVYGRHVVRRLAHRQHRIIAVSQTTANDIERFFRVPPECITVVPNGLDHDRFRPAADSDASAELLQRHGLRQPFFLYVSRLEHPAKNHVRLIAAFDRFKAAAPSPWQLVLLGSDWHGADVIRNAVRRSSYAADIHCLGFATPEDLPRWYQAAGAAVYPSLFEGFGLPALEAMACGCPLLAADIPALAEVCGGAALLTDPTDTAALERHLRQLAFDGAVRSRLRAAGLERVRAFDWKTTALATLDVYARAVRQPCAASAAPELAPATR